MDFRGQKLAERMYQVILVIAGIIAFLAAPLLRYRDEALRER